MAVRAVLAVGFVLLLMALAFVLFDSEQRQAGSNHVPEVEEVVKRRGDWRKCQDGEIVPKGAAALRLLVGTYGSPTAPLRITARSEGGKIVTAGSLPFGQREGHLRIPVRTVEDTRGGLRVCVSVSGSGRTVLYGAGGRLRLEWLRDGQESWFALLPAVAHRFGLGKANPFGGFLIVVAGLVLFASWLLAVSLVLCEVGR